MIKHLRIATAVAAVALIATACAVVPSYTASTSVFEGFPVISYVPPNPTGIIFLFHGTGGNANIATRLETTDMLNHLVPAGYGFVATDSTNRTTKQWDNASLSLTANPDLARLSRLYESLITASKITAQTPIYAIGMSDGAGFASVFAQGFKNAGYPVAAIAPSHGNIPVAVVNAGGLTVPALFALGANDPLINNPHVVVQVAQLIKSGVPAALYIEPETALQPTRFLRVPGIDGTTANSIFAAMVKAGLYDTAGHRLVGAAAVDSAFSHLTLPASVTADQRKSLGDEVDVVMAVHIYSATYAPQTAAFFAAHR